MVKTKKTTRRSGSPYTVGREPFAKIAAVEGVRASARVEEDFREFDRKGLSPEERRREILRKYGRKS
jgi:hypothetical protein